jgi:hypothetical protein
MARTATSYFLFNQEHGVRKNSDTDHCVATNIEVGYGAALKSIKLIKELGFASAIVGFR